MPQPKKIIVHIGIPKTGSTSIQQNLRQNEYEIQKYGYNYPSCKVKFPNGHIYHENHSKILFLLFKKDPEKFGEFSALNLKNKVLRQIKTRMRESFISEIQKPGAEKVILSSEALFQLTECELQDLKSFFSTHLPGCKFEILLFSRHPVQQAASSFQQNSKAFGHSLPIVIWPYSSVLTKFASVFSKDAISIYKYEDATEKKESIVHLLFEKIGLPKTMIKDHDRANTSLSQEALDLLTYINSRYPMMDGRWIEDSLVTRRCWGRIAEDIRPLLFLPGTKFELDISQSPNLMATAVYEINWLKDSYGISYSLPESEKTVKTQEIHSDAITYIEQQLPKLNSFLQKLTYDYFDEMSLDSTLSQNGLNEVRALLRNIRSRYPIVTKTPTSLLALKEEIKINLRRVSE